MTMPNLNETERSLADKAIERFKRAGHALPPVPDKLVVNGHWIYVQCEKCNISLYLWTQNKMPLCPKVTPK